MQELQCPTLVCCVECPVLAAAVVAGAVLLAAGQLTDWLDAGTS